MRFDIYSKKHFDNASASLTTTSPRLLRTKHRMWLSVHHFTVGQKKWHINGLVKAVGFFASNYHTIFSLLKSADGSCMCSCSFFCANKQTNKKEFVALGRVVDLLLRIKKNSNAFSRHLKSAKQDNNNHRLVEKLMGEDFLTCLNTNSCSKQG